MGTLTASVLPVRSDFYDLVDVLDPADRQMIAEVREFMTSEVAPIINSAWTRERFPHHLIPAYAKLGIAGLAYKGYGCPGRGYLSEGAVMMELASVGCSIATFHGCTPAWPWGRSIWASTWTRSRGTRRPVPARCRWCWARLEHGGSLGSPRAVGRGLAAVVRGARVRPHPPRRCAAGARPRRGRHPPHRLAGVSRWATWSPAGGVWLLTFQARGCVAGGTACRDEHLVFVA